MWLSELWQKSGFNVRAMFSQSYFSLPVLHNILNHFLTRTFDQFTCLPILEVDINIIINYDNDTYFSISTWEKLGASCDAKLEEKYNKNKRDF